jgi:hypothetical protein
VTVSRALGDATPTITLNTYAHVFDSHRNADRTRALLETSFGGLLVGGGEADSAPGAVVPLPPAAALG